MHTSTRLNTDCLLAQILICIHSHTPTHTYTHTECIKKSDLASHAKMPLWTDGKHAKLGAGLSVLLIEEQIKMVRSGSFLLILFFFFQKPKEPLAERLAASFLKYACSPVLFTTTKPYIILQYIILLYSIKKWLFAVCSVGCITFGFYISQLVDRNPFFCRWKHNKVAELLKEWVHKTGSLKLM